MAFEVKGRVLQAVARSGLSGGTQKALAYRAVKMAMTRKADLHFDEGRACLVYMEEALAAVGGLEGSFARPSITAVKEALRRHGQKGRRLAARFGRLSAKSALVLLTPIQICHAQFLCWAM